MARRGTSKSLSEDVYRHIREAIFNGTLKPGDRLQPAALSQEHKASTTVIREALALLVGERLVDSHTGRGYFIPEIERDSLRDLTLVRSTLDGLGVRLSIQRGGVEWESDLIAAHHRLSRTPRRTPDNPEHPSQDWARAHQDFHAQLVAGCNIPSLLDMSTQLSSATELYRVWAAVPGTISRRDVEAEHAAILQAVLEGDADRAATLLTEHYETTARLIVDNWPDKDQAEDATARQAAEAGTA